MGSVVVADEAQLPADEHFDAMVTYLRFKHAKDVLQLLPKIETDLKLPTGSLQFRQVARRSPLRVGLRTLAVSFPRCTATDARKSAMCRGVSATGSAAATWFSFFHSSSAQFTDLPPACVPRARDCLAAALVGGLRCSTALQHVHKRALRLCACVYL